MVTPSRSAQEAKMPKPTKRSHFRDNAEAYNEFMHNLDSHGYPSNVIKTMLETVSRTQAWLCLRIDGAWAVVPTKWCAETNMTPPLYESKRVGNLNVLEITNTIGELFGAGGGNAWDEIQAPHPAITAARRLAKAVGRSLRADTHFYVLRGEGIKEEERADVDAFERQIKRAGLSPEAIDALVARIAA